MKKQNILILGILMVAFAFGQRKIVVANGSNHAEIVPYASVKIVNQPMGTYSNEYGVFEISGDLYDSILISSIGYQSSFFSKRQLLDTVFLYPIYDSLSQIIIKNKLLKKKAKYGYPNAKSKFKWGPSNSSDEFAQRFTIPLQIGEIIKVKNIFLKSKGFDPERIVMLHIYNQDKRTGLPDEDIIYKKIIINKDNVTRNGFVLNLESENIFLQDSVFFIGFEWLSTSSKKRGVKQTLLDMTMEVSEGLTYSRSMNWPEYKWQPFHFTIPNFEANNNFTNTIFTVDLEIYK